jgi:hypothetical protein
MNREPTDHMSTGEVFILSNHSLKKISDIKRSYQHSDDSKTIAKISLSNIPISGVPSIVNDFNNLIFNHLLSL